MWVPMRIGLRHAGQNVSNLARLILVSDQWGSGTGVCGLCGVGTDDFDLYAGRGAGWWV